MILCFFLASLIPALVFSHCDPGFEKEKIENNADYICKKLSLTDQEVLDQLADLKVEQPAVVGEKNDPEQVLMYEVATDEAVTDEITTETLPPTSEFLTTSLQFVEEEEEVELQNAESVTDFPIFTTSSDISTTLPSARFCKPGFEAHAIVGSEDYACKPIGRDLFRSSRKLAQPQNQSGSDGESCSPKAGQECCTIRALASDFPNSDYFKIVCSEGLALKSFQLINGNPELHCCKLPQ